MKKLLIIFTALLLAPLTVGASYNSTPIWNQMPKQYVQVGKLVSFRVSAYDVEGDHLTYYAIQIPWDASFNSDSQIFSWVPQQTGIYDLQFRVFDRFNSWSDMMVTLQVTNEQPQFSGTLNNQYYSPNYPYQPSPQSPVSSTAPVYVVYLNQPAQPNQSNPSNVSSNTYSNSKPVNNNSETKKTPTVNISSNDNTASETPEINNQKLSLAATLIGVGENILLNPWILLIILIALAILLYRSEKKIETLEQELAMKIKKENEKSA